MCAGSPTKFRGELLSHRVLVGESDELSWRRSESPMPLEVRQLPFLGALLSSPSCSINSPGVFTLCSALSPFLCAEGGGVFGRRWKSQTELRSVFCSSDFGFFVVYGGFVFFEYECFKILEVIGSTSKFFATRG